MQCAAAILDSSATARPNYFAELVYDPLPPEPVPLPPELLPADPLLPGPVVPDPVPLALEPLPGLDLEPAAPPLLFAASPPVPDVFLSSEQPGNVIPRNPARMIAVPNVIPFLMVYSSRSGLTVTLALLKATRMPSSDLGFFAAGMRTKRLKLAAQAESVE
jgi:hypothetical protein